MLIFQPEFDISRYENKAHNIDLEPSESNISLQVDLYSSWEDRAIEAYRSYFVIENEQGTPVLVKYVDGSMNFTVQLPEPGNYTIWTDMEDEVWNWFEGSNTTSVNYGMNYCNLEINDEWIVD